VRQIPSSGKQLLRADPPPAPPEPEPEPQTDAPRQKQERPPLVAGQAAAAAGGGGERRAGGGSLGISAVARVAGCVLPGSPPAVLSAPPTGESFHAGSRWTGAGGDHAIANM
jgi:hypothetical protein